MNQKGEIKIKREFLEELLDDEIELWNLANDRDHTRLMEIYQQNIDQIKALLKGNKILDHNKKEVVLVAQRKDGKFLYLECSPRTTSPHYVDNPIDATHIRSCDIDEIHDAPYYFENSSRMRDWLKDCKMVKMKFSKRMIL